MRAQKKNKANVAGKFVSPGRLSWSCRHQVNTWHRNQVYLHRKALICLDSYDFAWKCTWNHLKPIPPTWHSNGMQCQSFMPTSLGVELFTSANTIVKGNKRQKGNTGSDYIGIAGNQDLSSGYNWGLHAWSIIPCTVCLHLLWFRPHFELQLKCLGPSPAAVVWPEGMKVAQYTHRRHKWHSSVPPCSTNQHPTYPFLVFLRLCIDSSTCRCMNYTCKVSLAAFLGPKCWRCNRCLHSFE